jgi:hypothetical protein
MRILVPQPIDFVGVLPRTNQNSLEQSGAPLLKRLDAPLERRDVCMLEPVRLADVPCFESFHELPLAPRRGPKVRRDLHADIPCAATELQVIGECHRDLRRSSRLSIPKRYRYRLQAHKGGPKVNNGDCFWPIHLPGDARKPSSVHGAPSLFVRMMVDRFGAASSIALSGLPTGTTTCMPPFDCRSRMRVPVDGPGIDPRICQTFAASPAEPGELPFWLCAFQIFGVTMRAGLRATRRRLCGPPGWPHERS